MKWFIVNIRITIREMTFTVCFLLSEDTKITHFFSHIKIKLNIHLAFQIFYRLENKKRQTNALRTCASFLFSLKTAY